MPWLAPSYPPYSSTAHPYLRIRPLARNEELPLIEVFAALSPRSRYMRYHTPLSALRPAMRRHLADVDGHRHLALVATLGGRPVGIARWIRDAVDPCSAELAVEVVDRLQGAGIGAALVAAAARTAKRAGVRRFVGYLVPGNDRAVSWARGLGAVTDDTDPDRLIADVAVLAAAQRLDHLPVA